VFDAGRAAVAIPESGWLTVSEPNVALARSVLSR
jgi:hypothetical protein